MGKISLSCVIVMLLIWGLLLTPKQTNRFKQKKIVGTCECGGFKSAYSDGVNQPVILQNARNVYCNNEGLEKCIILCRALTPSGKNQTKKICRALEDLKSSTIFLYVRVCGGRWQYTGWMSRHPTSCDKKETEDPNQDL